MGYGIEPGYNRALFAALLLPETDDPYERHAVRVIIREVSVGYLDREAAKDLPRWRGMISIGLYVGPRFVVAGTGAHTIEMMMASSVCVSTSLCRSDLGRREFD